MSPSGPIGARSSNLSEANSSILLSTSSSRLSTSWHRRSGGDRGRRRRLNARGASSARSGVAVSHDPGSPAGHGAAIGKRAGICHGVASERSRGDGSPSPDDGARRFPRHPNPRTPRILGTAAHRPLIRHSPTSGRRGATEPGGSDAGCGRPASASARRRARPQGDEEHRDRVVRRMKGDRRDERPAAQEDPAQDQPDGQPDREGDEGGPDRGVEVAAGEGDDVDQGEEDGPPDDRRPRPGGACPGRRDEAAEEDLLPERRQDAPRRAG